MKFLLPLLAVITLPVAAHEVHVRQQVLPVTVITLTYADGKPFAYEQFELTPQGAEAPSQVGRTDALGRVAVLPVSGKPLELVATSKDGHGTRLTLPANDSSAVPPAPTIAETPRWMMLVSGVSILFGVFGLAQLFIRSRSSPP
jgi:nickel transport protein